MKFLKNVISFLIPLFIVLFTFTLYSTITNIVDNYKKMIINDYAIVVVASTPLVEKNINSLDNIKVKKIQALSRKDIIHSFEKKLSKASLKLLKQKLPFFYKIYLNDYPTISQLDIIKQELQQISNIKRVETFSSDHSKIYALLLFNQKIISVLFLFLTIFAILILSKQISIWFFEHYKRITIIQYHGGTILYSAMPIIKVALLSSIIASLITIFFNINIKNNLCLILSPEVLSIVPDLNTIINIEYLQIISISFGISIISIVGILIKYNLSKMRK
jgi:cell division transport system permease protein